MKLFACVCALFVIGGCLGCDTLSEKLGLDKSPSAPTPVAGRIEITVTPTSVGYAGGAGVGGAICPAAYPSRWGPFNWVIKEVGGGTVTATSFRWAVNDASNKPLADDDLSARFVFDFTGTPGGTLPVAKGATLTSRVIYDCEAPTFPGGKAYFTVKGTNEAGTPVESTAVLTMLAP